MLPWQLGADHTGTRRAVWRQGTVFPFFELFPSGLERLWARRIRRYCTVTGPALSSLWTALCTVNLVVSMWCRPGSAHVFRCPAPAAVAALWGACPAMLLLACLGCGLSGGPAAGSRSSSFPAQRDRGRERQRHTHTQRERVADELTAILWSAGTAVTGERAGSVYPRFPTAVPGPHRVGSSTGGRGHGNGKQPTAASSSAIR